MSLLILLTGSIDPMGRAGVSRTDPELRLHDYAGALERWLQLSAELQARLLFCENSGWPLDRLRDVAARLGATGRVQFAQFHGNDYPRQLGKGHGEALIIDHAFRETIAEDREIEVVAKCTGRLFVRNARSTLARVPSDVDLMCALDGALSQADSRFFVARKGVFGGALLGMAAEVDEASGVYLEHVLAKRVLRAIADGARWRPLPRVPLYEGWSATGGHRYGGVRGVARWALHSALHAGRYRPRSPV